MMGTKLANKHLSKRHTTSGRKQDPSSSAHVLHRPAGLPASSGVMKLWYKKARGRHDSGSTLQWSAAKSASAGVREAALGAQGAAHARAMQGRPIAGLKH